MEAEVGQDQDQGKVQTETEIDTSDAKNISFCKR